VSTVKGGINSRQGFHALAILVSLITVVLQGYASALTVKNTKDSAPGAALVSGSLRWAIAETPVNGTVDFDASLRGRTILLKGGQLVVDKALHVKGPDCGGLTVSGNERERVFLVSGANVIISDLTIAKGRVAGPVRDDGDPSLQRHGGGIYNLGVLKLERVCVTGNNAPAGSGGGIFNLGVLNAIVESTISKNSAGQHGGGICNEQDMAIEGSAIFENASDGDGGGIQEAGTSRLVNTTIARNRARGAGGGINDAAGSTLKAYNVTIAGNSARSGGGVALLFGTWDLQNSIVADNTAPSAPDVRNVGDPTSPGAVGTQISVGNNLIGKTIGAGTGSFIQSDKLDLKPKLGPLQNNGGPTPTMALLPGSAAIDSGDNRWIEPPILDPALVSDQRGFMARVTNGGNGLIVDMGACEFAAAKSLIAQAIALLTPFRSSSDSRSARHATCAIRSAGISLDSRLWMSDALVTDCGTLVFAYGKEAASSLEAVAKSGKDPDCVRAVQNAVGCLLLADEQIVRATIDVALANSGSAEFIAEAREELAKARAAADRLQYKEAVGYYEQGWGSVRKAQGIQANDAVGDACRELKAQLEKDDFDRWGNGDRCAAEAAGPAPDRKRKSSRPGSK
jgi:hypothetical protein